MKIAIIVAMSKELNLLLPLFDHISEITAGAYTIHTGHIGRHEVAAMQCGIGKVNAAIATNLLIDTFGPQLVINTGVAGGTGKAGILDVVVGERVAYHDVWCGPGTQEGEASGCPRFFRGAPSLLSLPCLTQRPGIVRGLICSGDRFIASPAEVEHIRSIYPEVAAVDMESAAIAHVCHLRDIPFLSIRVMSDTPGDNDNNISQYENFWSDAPSHTFALLKSILSEING